MSWCLMCDWKYMKITLCGSIAFIDEMNTVVAQLEQMGHEVKFPSLEIVDDSSKMISVDTNEWVWKKKEEAMRNHFKKVSTPVRIKGKRKYTVNTSGHARPVFLLASGRIC